MPSKPPLPAVVPFIISSAPKNFDSLRFSRVRIGVLRIANSPPRAAPRSQARLMLSSTSLRGLYILRFLSMISLAAKMTKTQKAVFSRSVNWLSIGLNSTRQPVLLSRGRLQADGLAHVCQHTLESLGVVNVAIIDVLSRGLQRTSGHDAGEVTRRVAVHALSLSCGADLIVTV